jgi:superfamily II DNA or RNA helicase
MSSSGVMGFEALLGRLSQRAEIRGREFERICKWFLRSAPEYRGQLRNVWLWDEWPGRWAADAGVDLVAEPVEGALWAIQAKAYDPSYTIKKADVDSFLSESGRPEFGYRLLIATTDRLGQRARRTLAGQEKPAGVLLRSQLALAEVAWPASPSALEPPSPRKKRPQPHQRKAVAALVRGFRSTDRGQLVMACGTGKTLAACFLAKRLAARRVLVLVPSLSLLAQTLREWALGAEFSYLAVCSDETVTRDQTDALVTNTSELGFPVTTDPATIARFLRRRSRPTHVVFATYQSSPAVADALGMRAPAFDLLIADEAHRCAGPQAGTFATVLDQSKIRARKRLFMTATPKYFTGRVRKEAEEADWEIASMDDETRFGPVLHRLSFAQAIEQGLLSDYQVAVVGVSDTTYRDYAERGLFVTTDGEKVTDARTLASQLGLIRAMANYSLQRVVSFHSRIRGAASFARSLTGVWAWLPADRRFNGSLWAAHVSGEMTSGERDRHLNRLRAVAGTEHGVLSNARCLAEGVDVPTLDGVAFIDPRRSQVDVVQAVGRAIRKSETKTVGTVVIPIFVGDEADAEHALETSDFNRVWQLIRALRDHDELLAEELDELRRELGRRGTLGHRPEKIILDLPTGVGEEFARAFDSVLVSATTRHWEFMYGLLQRYAEREGHARPPVGHLEEGFLLGLWVGTQRNRRQTLPTERTARLEALPGWTWSAHGRRWQESFAALQRFVDREGHARPPLDCIEGDLRLGEWVSNQRQKYRRGVLAPDRSAQLEVLPGWVWKSLDAAWLEGYTALATYARREGHAQPPKGCVEASVKLGSWVRTQRVRYGRGTLGPDREAQLERIPGWTWSPFEHRWKAAYVALRHYVEQEGHARPPLKAVQDGIAIGGWVAGQRQAFRKGTLDVGRCRQLEALPGWEWKPKATRWEAGLAALTRFADREGHANPSATHVEDGFGLGHWVNSQRVAWKNGNLDRQRAHLLESLPKWSWSALDTDWENSYSALRRLAQREGHARPPQRLVEDGIPIGTWVASQRQRYKKGKLSPERVQRLESLPDWAWDAREATWGEHYQALCRYVEREGHARPQRGYVENGFKLGSWVQIQRNVHRRGRIDPERASRLEALPGWDW